MRKFWRWLLGSEKIEETAEPDETAHDIEYVTRIYGGGMEEGKWL